MTTTLTLIDTIKIDTRKDGAISYAKVCVMLDGVEMVTDFRAKVGEEPVTIDGDTITVSDAQIAAKRAARVYHARMAAEIEARATAEMDAEIAKLDAFLTTKNASPAAAEDLRAFIRASGPIATDLMMSPAKTRFLADRKAMMVRHGLIG